AERDRMSDRKGGDDPERTFDVAGPIDRGEGDEEQDVVQRLDVDDVPETELNVGRQLAHCPSAVEAMLGSRARARASNSVASAWLPSDRSISAAWWKSCASRVP